MGALILCLALRAGEPQGAAPSEPTDARSAPVSAADAPAGAVVDTPAPAPAAKHPTGIQSATTGIIPLDDNWGFVKLAYGVSGAGLLGYALSLWVRRPRTKVP
jgi:hypothetical protein